MIQIFAITALATIVGTILAVAIIQALRHRCGKLPELQVLFTDTTSRSRAGRQPESLNCRWNGKLEIQNNSPSDALALKVDLLNASHTHLAQPPGVLRAGERIELEVECSLDFDKREIHPSTYALPSTSPMPHDIDPLRECYPDELRDITVRITCKNTFDRPCMRVFKRSDGKSNQMILQRSSRRKGGKV